MRFYKQLYTAVIATGVWGLCVVSFAYDTKQGKEQIVIPPGLEIVKVGDTHVIVPEGAQVKKEGDIIVVEDVAKYAGRRFQELEEKFKNLQERQDRLEKTVEELQQAINALLKVSLRAQPAENKK